MKFNAIALCSALGVVSLSARAEGLYVGGSIGASHDKTSNPAYDITDRSASGLKAYGGYSVNPNFGVEAGYVDLGKFTGAASDTRASGLFLDAVGTLPLGNNVSALARVGVFDGKLKNTSAGSDTGTNLKVGAGLQYDLNRNVGVRGEWERYRFDAFGTKATADMYSVGVNYRF